MIEESLWVRLVYAISWPIIALVWLARRPTLRLIVAFPFIYLVLGLGLLVASFLEEPIDRRISALWFRWIDRRLRRKKQANSS